MDILAMSVYDKFKVIRNGSKQKISVRMCYIYCTTLLIQSYALLLLLNIFILIYIFSNQSLTILLCQKFWFSYIVEQVSAFTVGVYQNPAVIKLTVQFFSSSPCIDDDNSADETIETTIKVKVPPITTLKCTNEQMFEICHILKITEYSLKRYRLDQSKVTNCSLVLF